MAPTSAFTTTSRMNCRQLARSPRTSGRSITIRCPLAQDWLFALIAQADAFEILRLHRSEEHTSELQSRVDLVCRLLLEKKKTQGRDGRGRGAPARRSVRAAANRRDVRACERLCRLSAPDTRREL